MTAVAVFAATAASFSGPAYAGAATFLPPPGKAFSGLTGSQSVALYCKQVGKRPAVFGHFVTWGSGYEYAFAAAQGAAPD